MDLVKTIEKNLNKNIHYKFEDIDLSSCDNYNFDKTQFISLKMKIFFKKMSKKYTSIVKTQFNLCGLFFLNVENFNIVKLSTTYDNIYKIRPKTKIIYLSSIKISENITILEDPNKIQHLYKIKL